MTYAQLDPVISAWAEAHDLVVCLEWAGAPSRFAYVSGGPQECFQIVIGLLDEGRLIISVRDIETIDDAGLERSWHSDLGGLAATLEAAIEQVRAWDARSKGPATWQFPQAWLDETDEPAAR